MTENNDKINQLLVRLEALLKRQDSFLSEIFELKDELRRFKSAEANEQIVENVSATEDRQEINIGSANEPPIPVQIVRAPKSSGSPAIAPKLKSDLEKFIGENLINKIGIIITIIGVAIGAKYSIEHKLISPLTRIIIGYLIGLGLLGFGIKLKKNYESYSAVLVSGAMAILYFLTYAAYSFYGLIPQVVAFVMMVLFTAFTVMAAINYNRQVIGHIGMVGANAVPFLLSDGSGKVAILFSYIAIINIGILLIAFKKYWKALYYYSFLLTWLIFYGWLINNYSANQHFALSLIFLCIFFFIFYSIFLAYKLVKQEQFSKTDIILLLSNTFIFFGLGYYILSDHETAKQFLGVFTLFNAALHFMVAVIINRKKLADRNLFFLVAGLVLVFITMAIPIQLDGNWVTLLWVFEAVLLFWIGRVKKVPWYEELSYPLMIISFISLLLDWRVYYPLDLSLTPVAPFTSVINIHFLTSILFAAGFIVINYLNYTVHDQGRITRNKLLYTVMGYVMPAILILVLYSAFKLEISSYFDRLYINSSTGMAGNYENEDLQRFKNIWVTNYSLLFFSVLTFVNINKLKLRRLGQINLIIDACVLMSFLFFSMISLNLLRDSYLNNLPTNQFHAGSVNLWIRYISFAFVVMMLISIYRYTRQEFMKTTFINIHVCFDLLLSVAILVIASNELITWMEIMKYQQSDKLWLSILWGIYSLVLISIGIWKNKKHLRIAAIVLFGITLIKLFFYDLQYLSTISKTIVFVSLGILLLIISFLYNKYKNIITDNN